jgi:hypothetical protein
MQTAGLLPYPKLTWKSLDELDAGVCDGMTYEEIEVRRSSPLTCMIPAPYVALLSLLTPRILPTGMTTSSTTGIVVSDFTFGH